ncbi:MAG: ABC transporter ATP-binding protein [bacterium]|nr:ABC transporter ATP-binding protein [bacterium]
MKKVVTKKANPLIELKNLVKIYGEGETAAEVLHGISLKINQGEMVAIMGTSGSGKSTLMNILGTLDHLSSGDYFFAGKKIDDYKPEQLARLRNREIGFVFQSFNLLPRLTVEKNIERPMLYGQVPKTERQARINNVLEKVGLLDKKDKYPLKLSGGQQQRVALARALVMQPNLILADEPTGALDSKTATMVMNELKHINQDTGTTIVIITHDERVASFAQRTIHLQDGKICS